ncbi:cobyrinic acid a,c-diamide synthase [Xanthomonas phaseoli pv. phaseoli]|nr:MULTISPECIES: MinD/ParA family protein [Xanthomonas]MBO9739083.1 MinD/ParA family protein [Xanthomonas axonopodis pv. begoniae]MBV6783373.1 MinD/ParA family protein [Xanthomonas campestris pv. trichodesmae]MBV6839541.1 MinD/ParA family protein [Xanthomonas campestris pv. merremiae]OHX24170.1 cobyrinic acid a,c-diamide synthase [Xanthomonas alfalfae]OOW58858.1 cobyrinic acid a,c-diamide synthase [Xanthomonas campestris pv. centellae]OOW60215.1 cobyrinic acid a,c-diamide synthase [Xanthomona
MQSREYAKLTNAFPLSATRPEPLGPVRTIAVTGGKGGVGKTNISANLAVALADMGKRTLLLDADLGLANLDVVLGLAPKYTLADLIAGRCTLDEVIIEGPGGVLVVPAASGRRHMAELAPAQHIGLVNVFSELERDLDVMVIDTAAGITDSVLTFCQAAQDTVVVVCDEPASITDAYALIKVLSRERGVDRLQIIANMVRDPNEGRLLYDKLSRVCEKFLGDVSLNYLGHVPQDDWLRLSVQRQQPVIKAYPASPSAQAIAEIARRTSRWQAPTVPRGNVEFFVERIIQRGVAA